ncbi:MAG: hypothetical protein OXU29_02865 [Gammaproteobacteria bacterium]|nr:hypothetical protein [Gammaproteobacteria bacterium]MDD9799396.1 hypothetical protein [Gammaproteobacteria bacterium]MDD9850536.1 hypothetical protein [Gammaproteobacteria bacterium]MDD9870475.1 hypothetical protein [Gammaproteobacteria bacterium]
MLKSFAAGIGVLSAIAAYVKLRKSKKREKDLKKKEEELNERIRRMNEMHPGIGTYLNDFFQAILRGFRESSWSGLREVTKKCGSGGYGSGAKRFQFYARMAIFPILLALGIPLVA